MKAVIQRVSSAKVTVKKIKVGEISKGLLVFLCVEKGDTEKDIDYMLKKIIKLRIFSDKNDKMNLNVENVLGQILCISQFTLCADCNSSNRPSFSKAENFNKAKELYQIFINKVKEKNIKIEEGIFGADMKVELENDGPVTIILNSR